MTERATEKKVANRGTRPPSERRTRGRPKVTPDESKQKAIAAAAWQLLIERGYGGTTMSDVAAAARVSMRTVYRLFPGKTELFAGVVDLHRHSMLALPGDYDGCTFQEALEAIFQIDIDPETDRARTALMTLFIVEGRQYPELEPLVRERGGDKSMALLAEWLKEQAARGRAAIPHPDVAAKMLMDVVFGAISLKTGDGAQWPGGTDRPTYLKICIGMIVEGLEPDG